MTHQYTYNKNHQHNYISLYYQSKEGEPAQDQAAPSLIQVMDVLGEFQLSIGQINTRLDSMNERLNSLGTQMVLVWKSYMVIQLNRDPPKPPNHLLMHDHFISYAFHF